jgi:hypothetical protein
MKRILPALLLLVLLASQKSYTETLLVRDAGDSGPSTLREALALAKDGDRILFELRDSNPVIILNSELSISGKSILIDGRNLASETGERVTIQVLEPGRSPYRVLRIDAGPGNTVTLMHLRIRGGDVSSLQENRDGGALHIGGAGAVTLLYCDIRDGKAHRGGGIFAGGRFRSDTLRMQHCRITENAAVTRHQPSAGGGVYVSFGTALLYSTSIEANTSADYAGGMYLYNAAGIIIDTEIIRNSARDEKSRDGSFTGPSLIFRNMTTGDAIAASLDGNTVEHSVPATTVGREVSHANVSDSHRKQNVSLFGHLLLPRGLRLLLPV